MRRSVFALLLLLAVAARADDRVLRIGDSKGVYRALLAAGAIDLRGRRVATNKGSVGHHLVLAALQREKIPFRDVTIEFLLPSDAKAALGGGSVDAWSTWDPQVSIAEQQDHLRPIVDGSDLPISDSVLVSGTASIAAKRALLQDFLGRQARAQAWALGHPAEYARLYSDQTGLSPEVGRLVVAHMNVHMVPIDDAIVRAHQEVAELFFEAGVIWQRIDVVPAFDRSRFLDAGPTPRAPAP